MDLGLSDEQALLAQTVTRAVENEASISVIRGLLNDPRGIDLKFWRRIADVGCMGLLVSELHGGSEENGGGLVNAALVCEVMGGIPQPGPLAMTMLVAQAIDSAGSLPEHSELLADLLSGDAIATWAIAERGNWDPAAIALQATATASGFELRGEKSAVQDSGIADYILVTARLDGAFADFLVPNGAAGLVQTPLASLDLTRRFGHLTLDGVRLPKSSIVGEPRQSPAMWVDRLDQAVILQCAESVGSAARAFDMALEYSKDRISFGRPIGSYQAIKHRLADMKLLLEACLATAAGAARDFGQGAAPTALASSAKIYIAESCTSIVQSALQIHGGIGFTWEHDIHLYLRRVKTNEFVLGSPEWHRGRVCAALHG